MKKNWKQWLYLGGGLFMLAAIAFILSFFTDDETFSRLSLFISIIVGLATLFCAIASFAVAYYSEIKLKKQHQELVEINARKFIINNSEEIYNLPLCLLAFAYDKHKKYNRKIYREFNILTKEEQISVLKQLDYDYKLIESNDFIDNSLTIVKNYIKDNDLGRDFLYDDCKYYRRAINYASELYSIMPQLDHSFPEAFTLAPKIKVCTEKELKYEGVNFFTYLDDYIKCKRNDQEMFALTQKGKPVDLLIEIYDLRNAGEEVVCYWMMELVDDISAIIMNEIDPEREKRTISPGDSQLETYEDRFLCSLLVLYNLSSLTQK